MLLKCAEITMELHIILKFSCNNFYLKNIHFAARFLKSIEFVTLLSKAAYEARITIFLKSFRLGSDEARWLPVVLCLDYREVERLAG